MPLSWNEIRKRAIEFSQEYANATRENAETQSFYNEFFNVFGISRRRVAAFEEPVKKLGDKRGRIDLFWKGVLLIEQKSSGRDLEAAYTQALNYFPNLKEEELPQYILVSDFQRFELYDLETKAINKFTLAELHKNVELFGFIAGYQKREFKDQDPVNIEASERMGKLHDMLGGAGYTGHELELFLVRLLFCLFAEDTTIFEKGAFQYYIETKTKEDGSDLGMHLATLFQVLNTPEEKRQKSLDEALAAFAYINGNLFAATLPIPAFDSAMRDSLISACYFDWSRISPAIFGSLFQSVMDKDKRRGVGAHYTTEKNIMKILKPLFLDALYEEFEKIKRDKKKLQAFHDKLAKLTFFDPACGCGNFLILAYRELRELEIKLLKALHGEKQQVLDVSELSRIDVDKFYGIEVEEFPAKIAEVALWLIDHQMNIRLSEAFGIYYVRLPLKKSAHIHHDNALRLNWKTVIAPEKLSYILGNPPFVGYKLQNKEQHAEMEKVFHGVSGAGVLDFVAAWFFKAAQYIQNTNIQCAFVSTNSISQGEQVAVLWRELFDNYGIKINFAHRTFAWGSDAPGAAAVHCVIIGFATFDAASKLLYDYDTPKSDPHEVVAKNINPYLVDADTAFIGKSRTPICNAPTMDYGSEPREGGYLILSDKEKAEMIASHPETADWIKRFVSADDYINNINRWCLWLVGVSPEKLKSCKPVSDRLASVRDFRSASLQKAAHKAANTPSLFVSIRQPSSDYLLVPIVSSERRAYVPIGWVDKNVIVSNACFTVPHATIYHFGVITSAMHMTWMRYVCGRLKSDYRYSNGLVYNNFPWPTPTAAQTKDIEAKAQAVLDARAAFPDSSLAALYDPLTMPPALLKAHFALDKAVDAAYRKAGFNSERERIEYLFTLYQQLTAPLIAPTKKRGKK
jgi:hypothetical protein